MNVKLIDNRTMSWHYASELLPLGEKLEIFPKFFRFFLQSNNILLIFMTIRHEVIQYILLFPAFHPYNQHTDAYQ